MGQIKNCISIIILTALFAPLYLFAETSDTLYVSPDSLATGTVYLSDMESQTMWRYHPGDDSTWALPDFDDSDWDNISPWMSMDKFDVTQWTGIGWFRKVIKLDSSLRNSSLGMYVHHEGSSEIYLNGKKIFTFGENNQNSSAEEICDPQIYPHLIFFDSNAVYTLAVRYSNHKAVERKYLYEKFFGHIGFSISLCKFSCNIENRINDLIDLLSLRWDMAGFYLAFSLIFFLLYFFYSKRRENLYFALFAIGLSIFGIAINLNNMSPASLEIVALYRLMSFVGISLIFIFFLLFIYEIVYRRIIKLFWLFLLSFFIINMLAFFGSKSVFSYIVPLTIVIGILSIESIRVVIVGMTRKVEYIWILAVGAFIFLLLTMQQIIFINPIFYDTTENILFIFSLVSLPISMAIYLAKTYAGTNEDLGKQIRTVKDLSAKQIEQERRNAELQLQAELERAESERKSRELEEARTLQLSMLPKEVPQLSQLDIAACMKTATEVGGDFYDFRVGVDNTLTAIIADATGHGMQAGTMVAASKGLFQNLAEVSDLKDMFHQFNRAICAMGLQPLLNALLALRVRGKQLEIISGGMPDLLIYKKNNDSVKEIESSGPPLGAFCDYIYKMHKTKISQGDVILSMSDGFIERFNTKDEMLGSERCKQIFRGIASTSSREMIDQFLKAGDEWGGSRQQDDDITFVVMKCK